MRRELATNTDARVVLGGKPDNFLGLYPGILEEALLAISRKQPLYVLGGFGGAAGVVAQTLMGHRPAELSLEYQRAQSKGYAEAMDAYQAIRDRRPELDRRLRIMKPPRKHWQHMVRMMPARRRCLRSGTV